MLWCLHGALGSFRDWDGLVDDEAHAVDLWQTPQAGDMHHWATEWTATVAKIDPTPILLGYSMGGRLALHALLAAPTLWKKAIIISAHPGLHDESQRRRRQECDATWLTRFQTEPFQDVMCEWNTQPVFANTSDKTPSAFKPGMARGFEDWSLGHQESLWDRLAEIRTPVLWLCGETDPKFGALGNEAVRRLPHGTYVEAPNCGHRVPWEWNDFPTFLTEIVS
ncbi:MAG: 2-succinyl-6-hydroxy-2,4-cyclohexadiene-1-carboxylate synthase [Verrucomicrobiales bacterium]|jgi:2-succinyl-6-hydroxy-2,4-cyclohexadiene-1-carboxylate synthase